MSESDRRYEVSPEVAQREIEGQLLLLTPNDDVLYTLNGTGRLAWERLVAGASRHEIVETIVATYGIAAEKAASDLDAFARELEKKGVLSRAS